MFEQGVNRESLFLNGKRERESDRVYNREFYSSDIDRLKCGVVERQLSAKIYSTKTTLNKYFNYELRGQKGSKGEPRCNNHWLYHAESCIVKTNHREDDQSLLTNHQIINVFGKQLRAHGFIPLIFHL